MTLYLNFKTDLKVEENIIYPQSMDIGPVIFSCQYVEKAIEVLIEGLDKKPIVRDPSEATNESKKRQGNSKQNKSKNSTDETHSETQTESDVVKKNKSLNDDNEDSKEQANGKSKLSPVEDEGMSRK
mgnify:CR=1 FL=1